MNLKEIKQKMVESQGEPRTSADFGLAADGPWIARDDSTGTGSDDPDGILALDLDADPEEEGDIPRAGDPELTPDLAPLEAVCGPEVSGERLDVAVARVFASYSRNRLQTWIKAGRLTLDGRPCTEPKTRLKGGESIRLLPELAPEVRAYLPEDLTLDVVYQDPALLVVNKPAGLVVHPAAGNWSGTLLNGLLHWDPGLAQVPRAGIVHRLDKETSGLMVVARSLEAQTDLVRQLQARTVKREYLALAWGEVPPKGTVDAPIGRHPRDRLRMAVVDSGKPARTHYEVLERFTGCALIRCRLETGRTHQIRVHLASLGHPLLGDPVYGRGRPPGKLPPSLAPLLGAFEGAGRQALHAFRLGLLHPVSGEALSWEAPLPEDLSQLVEQLRLEQLHGN